MDAAVFEVVSFWSKAVIAICGVVIAVAAVLALYASSRLTAIKDEELKRVHASSQVAIASADARAAEAIQRASAAQEAAAAVAARAGRLESKATPEPAPARVPRREAAESSLPRGTAHPRLTAEQRQAMVSILKAARLPQQIQLTWVANPATYALAKEIWDALEEAGWAVHATGGVLTPSPPSGVVLATRGLSNETLLRQGRVCSDRPPTACHATQRNVDRRRDAEHWACA